MWTRVVQGEQKHVAVGRQQVYVLPIIKGTKELRVRLHNEKTPRDVYKHAWMCATGPAPSQSPRLRSPRHL